MGVHAACWSPAGLRQRLWEAKDRLLYSLSPRVPIPFDSPSELIPAVCLPGPTPRICHCLVAARESVASSSALSLLASPCH